MLKLGAIALDGTAPDERGRRSASGCGFRGEIGNLHTDGHAHVFQSAVMEGTLMDGSSPIAIVGRKRTHACLTCECSC